MSTPLARRAPRAGKRRPDGQTRPERAARPTRGPARGRVRLPRSAWVCAAVACLNAVCWSLLTPAFQVPDEPDHFAYVKQLADTGSRPTSSVQQTSSREVLAALEAVRYYQVRQQPQNRPVHTEQQQQALERSLALAPRAPGSQSAGLAASEPPLYYALEAIPYELARGGTVLDRLQAMRVFSALFAGLTALFAFLFLREALPAVRWAWTVGGLAVALFPLLGQMSGAVNPDAMLFAVSAACLYCLARAFRRGLDVRGALAIGAVTATGLLTKVNFIGLVPGVALGLLLLSVRARRTRGRTVYGLFALSLAVALSPAAAYAAVNVLSGQAALGVVSRTLASTHGALLAQLDYTWQLFLPRLPGTADYFPGLFTARQLWFDGLVGLYGWIDTPFPGWVYTAALLPAAAIALLCGRSLLQARTALRARAGELVTYAAMGIGLMALIGLASFRSFPTTDAEYAQARYLLPLLALFGAAVALAARGAGRRWGPVAGALLVVLFLAHDIFSQLQAVARFYG